jgi:hypothetical protein
VIPAHPHTSPPDRARTLLTSLIVYAGRGALPGKTARVHKAIENSMHWVLQARTASCSREAVNTGGAGGDQRSVVIQSGYK